MTTVETRYGTIVVGAYVDRFPDRPFNTGQMWFSLNSTVDREFIIPNVPDTFETMRLMWSEKWMRARFEYHDQTYCPYVAFSFTFSMDGQEHEICQRFGRGKYRGFVVFKYAGRWE